MYNLNYMPTSGVQSLREIISGCTRTIKVEYHWSKEGYGSKMAALPMVMMGQHVCH
jgi:hypothetical protein